MTSTKRAIPYRKRIIRYCENNAIQIPHGFDAPKPSYKYAIIDITSAPFQLCKYSTYSEKVILEFLSDPVNKGKQFKILDFKKCVEVEIDEGGRFCAGKKFECEIENELPYLVQP